MQQSRDAAVRCQRTNQAINFPSKQVACCTGSCLPMKFSADERTWFDSSVSPTRNECNVDRTSSFHSHRSILLSQSSSSSMREGSSQPKRKRPLAVPVGFKYAEDINGRPIVITPGNRCMLVHNRRNGSITPGSPASQHVRKVPKKELNHSFFPIQNRLEQLPMQQLSYKPPPPHA